MTLRTLLISSITSPGVRNTSFLSGCALRLKPTQVRAPSQVFLITMSDTKQYNGGLTQYTFLLKFSLCSFGPRPDEFLTIGEGCSWVYCQPQVSVPTLQILTVPDSEQRYGDSLPSFANYYCFFSLKLLF